MIITKDFVIINLPKTGSTFVRKVVKEIYFRRNKNAITRALHKLKIRQIGYKELMTQNPMVPNHKDQHGCYDEIPKEHQHKQILAAVRDPYLRIESSYRFRWWSKFPFLSKQQIAKEFPTFPDLSFQDFTKFYAMESEIFKQKYEVKEGLKIGKQSIQFVRLFFVNHREVFQKLSRDYILGGHFKKDICNVTFLRNENLNEELAMFLSEHGFSQDELDFIRSHQKVNATKNESSKSHMDQHLVDFVNEYEWVMLEILAALGIDYRRS